MQRIAVIGLGRFGSSLTYALADSGVEVLAIDEAVEPVDELMDVADVAVRLDSTDREALISQGVDKVDVCVVAIGEDFEAALLTTVIVKRLGVPMVVCRAQTPFHAEIFKQIGADRVIQPEQEAGRQLARQLASPELVDIVPLAEGYTLIEMRAPELFRGKTIRSLELRQKYDVNLVVIKRPMHVDALEEVKDDKLFQWKKKAPAFRVPRGRRDRTGRYPRAGWQQRSPGPRAKG
ncbi:MAG: TrkA family potassium uptake protein [Planctomycetaceae bacterium]